MKINFEDLVKEHNWLHTELLNSLNNELINDALEKQEYEVFLLINGQKVEPKVLTSMFEKLERYIKLEAQSLLEDELEEAKDKAWRLTKLVEQASADIIDKFCIEDDNDLI